ncbi:hypothetical protein [Acinetobacter baumannii]|uniref:hypothetical protein n=1 Tax=Acinetobacter baumannii TaxID=470 RepID=UPI000DF454F0|nr:hypothetical protein [Acinetobacter baumannii]RCT89687.1 hypothetical protein DVA68_15930 [Acinetobacter baumannii]
MKKIILVALSCFLLGCTDAAPKDQLVEFTSKAWNFLFSLGYFLIIFGVFNIKKAFRGLTRLEVIFLGVSIALAAYLAFIIFKAFTSIPLTLYIPFFN